MNEIKPLTSLRMLAAFWVFLFHSAYPADAHTMLDKLIAEGHVGVTLFFVLSGFLITLRYYDAVQSHAFSMHDYLIKRAARILPLYFLLVTLFYLVTQNTSTILVSYTLTQAYFANTLDAGLSVAWTLGVEELFYLCAPALFLLIARWGAAKTLPVVVVGAFVLGLMLVAVSNATGTASSTSFLPTIEHMARFTLFGRAFDFAVGVALARLSAQRKLSFSSNWALLGFAGAGIGMLMMHAQGGPAHALVLDRLLALPFGLVVITLTNRRGWVQRVLSQPALVYGGRISYAVYLLHHMFLGEMLLGYGWLRHYLFVTFLAVCFYEGVERPAQRLIVNRYRRKQRIARPA